ncbi:MAG: hypothetical protein IPJ32_12240 [Sphingobacteriaceae bacterium]|nr:hypothetical protein [Sphingobacteriaceae bacterium]
MAKGLNKHTPNSDELLKRLETNDSSGLDDFEKEALEGFDSLENVELAKNLTDSLNKKIDEKYLNKEGGNKKELMYLSMAAGLVLVVGLSIFFMNIMGDKKEMAMESAPTTEQITNEVAKPSDLAPAEEEPKAEGKGGELNTISTTDALAEKAATGGGKDISELDRRAKTESDKDDGLTSRRVVKETKAGQSIADSEGEKDFKQQPETKTTSGPPAGISTSPSSPIVLEDLKSSDREEESNEKISLSKNNSDANKQAEGQKESGVKKRAAPKKEKAKNSEALASDDIAAKDESIVNVPVNVSQQTVVGGVAAAEPKRDESGYLHNVEYGNHAYYKPQDYLKVEINKSEMLKTNVKAFKAELTINEKGTVTAVKFLTTFDNCTGCKKELEKILLKMPGWKPKSKSAVETVSYIDQ